MNQFQYSFYHIFKEKVENELEPIFREFKNQIDIYNRQFCLTLKSYKLEWTAELNKNEEIYKSLKEKAEADYKKAVEEFEADDESGHSYAMSESGLDIIPHQYDAQKEEINNEYNNFFDLYSKSILIALYSLTESNLNRIMELSSNVFVKKIKPSHFNTRDYLNSTLLYLDLVLEIETTRLEPYISQLKEIQFLRNGIVHNNSIFTEIGTASNIAKKYNKSLKYDRKSMLLKISSSNFVIILFQLLKEFFEELYWQIDIKQNSIIIRNGLIHWLGLLN
ncbi:MAG: hypothetical protein WD398_10505 [Cyclobacteriaceae bacterium]